MQNMSPANSGRARIRVIAIAAGIALAVLAGFWVWSRSGLSDDELLDEGAAAIAAGDFEAAERASRRILETHPGSFRALTMAATAAEKAGRKAAALDYLVQIAEAENAAGAPPNARCGSLALELGRLSTAEFYLRRALSRNPDDADLLRKLIFLLRIEGRNWEARPFVWKLFSAGVMEPDHLYLAGSTELVWLSSSESQFLEFCRSAEPDDPVTSLGGARNALLRHELHPALEILQRTVSAHPEVTEAQARLGGALFESRNFAEFVTWHRRLPPAADDHPDIWYIRGFGLRETGDITPAIRCFAEAVRRHPDHRGANYQLSQLLQVEAKPGPAQVFADRAAGLARMEYLLREVQHSPDLFRELISGMESLGRLREAAGWAQLVYTQYPRLTWARAESARLQDQLSQDPSRLPTGSTLLPELDRSTDPLPDWDEWLGRIVKSEPPRAAENAQPITFADVAGACGISFHFDNGANPAAGRAYMFEFNGGGAAVIDYDGNGWPDLYLTQGGPWPQQGGGRAPRDRLYANTGEGLFADVTRLSGLGDERYSAGAAVGDYDNDGFPDLYVANIGPDRFYHNNGDGTFTELADAAGAAGNEWSLSCALADLNGDGNPDLYVVNYLGGPDVFERACTDHGRPVQCQPTSFPAEQDRLYLNLGDGGFRDVTHESGIELPDGKGMGLIVADLSRTGFPDVFVANDTTANFLFRNLTPAAGMAPRLSDRAVLDGVAFNDRGVAQSSMGVAAGDLNDDGLLDLFVTNFIRESGNFYRQRPDGTFEDAARQAGLAGPTLNVMGWGAQALDADLDGRLDLVVANGHLDDYSAGGVPYKMPTQVFRNLGGGRFDQVPARTLGPYFERQVLGRAIARLDWNRDGREDFCVTHVGDAFALLSNSTPSAGHSLRIALRGVRSSRDAIGTTLRITAGERTLVRQLTAGDGFEASNSRLLIIGLGPAAQADAVIVDWPSGAEQKFSALPAEGEWLLIEGRPLPIRLPAP
jgi:tetratricopeptide (TPR) repeat protein